MRKIAVPSPTADSRVSRIIVFRSITEADPPTYFVSLCSAVVVILSATPTGIRPLTKLICEKEVRWWPFRTSREVRHIPLDSDALHLASV